MKTGFLGTFVISWSQTEIDGLEAAPVHSLKVGAAWAWRGDAIRVDGPNDILRLDELGIENCYDLATIDFIPLVLKTPYSARQIVDWILQAKLCSCFSESVIDLRKYGIRHITQLAPLTDKQLSAIAEETSVTLYALEMAKKSVENDQEIHRLAEVGMKLSVFSMNPAPQKPLPEAAFNGDRRLV